MQSLRAVIVLGGIVIAGCTNSLGEALIPWCARMKGLGETLENSCDALLIAVVDDDWLFRDSMKKTF